MDKLTPLDRELLEAAVSSAALKWCGEKERETSLDDIRYFESNWRALPGLREYVDRARARNPS